jgi:5-methylcytosine-specific restriction endonuclease McrA
MGGNPVKTVTGIAGLTNEQLHRVVVSLARQERECTLSVVDHLIEIERRRMYAELGHSSVYGYCTDELGYSRTAANRRIVAARTVRRFPRTRRLLAERRLTLSTLAVVAGELNGENCRALLTRICGKSAEEAQRAIAELRGIRPVREKIQRVVAVTGNRKAISCRKPETEGMVRDGQPASLLSPASAQPALTQHVTRNEVRCGPERPQGHATDDVTRTVPTEHRFRFEFSGDEAFMTLYRRATALVSNRLGGSVTIEDTMRLALEALVDRDAPERRKVRREQRAGRRAQRPVKAGKQHRSRHIPAGIRDTAHERDGSRCTFVSDRGQRCRARHNLQVDHVVPWAKGGTHDLDNLRLLCATHNRLMAQREFGPASIPSRRE